MIIDFHTHIFPDFLAERAVTMLAGQSENINAYTDGTSAGLLDSMSKYGIDKSVVLNIATHPKQNSNVNKFAIEANSEHVIAFGSVHQLNENWKYEIDRLVDNGIKGIKMHPDYQDFFVDDKIVYPIYEYIFEKEIILMLHSGIDFAYPELVHCPPERLRSVIDDFPGGTFIAAHMGGFNMYLEVEKYLIGLPVYFDTSYSTLDTHNPHYWTELIKSHGVDKILLGSDSPWKDQGESKDYIYKLDLCDDEKDMILGGNAVRLLGL